MLYDPKWEQNTKTNPLTLPAVIAWLEKQDPKQRYNFNCVHGGCLIGLYYIDVFGADFFTQQDRPLFADVFGPPNSRARYDGYSKVASDGPHTFGAALGRARAYAAAAY